MALVPYPRVRYLSMVHSIFSIHTERKPPHLSKLCSTKRLKLMYHFQSKPGDCLAREVSDKEIFRSGSTWKREKFNSEARSSDTVIGSRMTVGLPLKETQLENLLTAGRMAAFISRKEGKFLKRKLPLSHIFPLFLRPRQAFSFTKPTH